MSRMDWTPQNGAGIGISMDFPRRFSTPVGHGNLWVVDLRVVLGWAGFVLDDVW